MFARREPLEGDIIANPATTLSSTSHLISLRKDTHTLVILKAALEEAHMLCLLELRLVSLDCIVGKLVTKYYL